MNSFDHIKTIFKHCHGSENVDNLLIFTENVLDLWPKKVCAFEMVMYVHWTCINVNIKVVHASIVLNNGKDIIKNLGV